MGFYPRCFVRTVPQRNEKSRLPCILRLRFAEYVWRCWYVSNYFPVSRLTSAAINYYSPTLFGSLGISDVALYTGIYGLVKAVASIIFYGALIDVWGRRNPTIISSIACSICLWIVGAYVKIGNPAAVIEAGEELSPSTAAGGRAATAMIMIYSVLYVTFLHPNAW
jgi:MFS family permease